MTEIHVSQVTHLYQPSLGGIENYAHRLNESLREAGHTTTTFTTDLSLADDDTPVADEDVRYCTTVASLLRNPLSLELHRTLRESELDLYHLHNPWLLPTLTGAHALDAGAPTVMTVHSAAITSHSRVIRALNTTYKPFAQYVFDRVDHSFVQGPTEKRRLLDRFDVRSEDVSVVPNGIHPDEYDVPDTAVSAFREDHGLDPAIPTVLYVSRLIPEKNPRTFVEAVADHLDGRDLQALVVGTGEETFVRDLRRRADSQVRFSETVAFEALKAAYHASDLFVFLGTWEGLPTVILEAMNARLPIVSTPVGAIPDAVAEPDNGLFVPTSPTPRAVATAIRYYLDQPDERVAVGERNRDRVRAEYKWTDVAESIIERYEEVRADYT